MLKSIIFKISAVLILLFLIFLFYYNYTQHYSDNKNRKIQVTFWTLQLGTFDSYVNNIIDEFERNNSDIKIKWIDVPYSEGEKRTLAAILSDNPPDLINLTPDFSMMLAQKNTLYEIKPQYLKNYIPAVNNSLKFDNKYFGIPFYVTSPVTLYNKALYNKNGISTYNELFSTVPDKNSYITMLNFSENDTLLKLLNKYNINSPSSIKSVKSIELFKTFKRLYDKGYIPRESVTQNHRDSLEKYMSGQLYFLVTGANFLNMIKENAPDIYKNTGILPQLTGDNGFYDFSLMNFVIPKKSKNHDAALNFALFFTNKKNQLDFAKLTPILPANNCALKDSYFVDNSKKFETDNNYIKYIINSDIDITIKARMISAWQLNNLQPGSIDIKKKKDLNTLSSNYIQKILINNEDIKNTLSEFAQEWENL